MRSPLPREGEDEPLDPWRYVDDPPVEQDRIRDLPAGETVPCRFDLCEIYGELASGRYAVRACYELEADNPLVTRLGLTPLQFDRIVMYIELD